MIVVIPFREPEDIYNEHGVRVIKEGDVVVSHGVDLETGKIVILPCEPFNNFVRQECYFDNNMGEWVLK